MQIPPDELPDGLTPQQYQRLFTLYSVMGKLRCAQKAIERATPSVDDGPKSINESNATADEEKRALQLGQQMALKLMQFALASQTEQAAGGKHLDTKAENILADIQSQFESMGLSHNQVEELAGTLKKSVSNAALLPPREVPENLAAEEYYKLGRKYKELGWTEQSRDAMQAATELDRDGQWGVSAQKFLKTKIPRHPVPLCAEQANVQGFNAMAAEQDDTARSIFQDLIQQYPDFEWPYGNLGSLYIRDGRLQLAKAVLEKAVSINPSYINGWLHLTRARILDSDFAGARECLNKVALIDAEDPALEQMQALLREVESWGDAV